MKLLLRLEEAAMLLFSVFLFSRLHFAWWWYIVLFLSPDLSMLGYLFGNKAGAIVYNLFHHKAIALAVYVSGFYIHNEIIMLIGIILFGHASFDRILGYGLKYFQGFNYTSIGVIGKVKD